jgi:hypothetical protein
LLLTVAALFAQSDRGTITGTATDAAGAVSIIALLLHQSREVIQIRDRFCTVGPEVPHLLQCIFVTSDGVYK